MCLQKQSLRHSNRNGLSWTRLKGHQAGQLKPISAFTMPTKIVKHWQLMLLSAVWTSSSLWFFPHRQNLSNWRRSWRKLTPTKNASTATSSNSLSSSTSCVKQQTSSKRWPHRHFSVLRTSSGLMKILSNVESLFANLSLSLFGIAHSASSRQYRQTNDLLVRRYH